ncbi:MAG: HIT domain-containing protein [Deltaproteobacteria bacterium]|nr:HIT domain-containing protein [Deltaproteobacteria bacterium]MBN2671666.1 HIT domain-containing protein [Deltaproteobacteria bacterium]
MSKQLWAPWRMDYIKELDTPGCVFCQAAAADENQKSEFRILARRADEFVILNKYPYTFGHILICPVLHKKRLEDLSKENQQSLFALAVDAQVALQNVLHPHGLNWGINIGKEAGAGIETHLHIHIVPRWVGDTNFMPVVADCHIMPGHLNELYTQLLTEFEKL